MKRKLDMSNQTFLRFDHVNRKPTSIHMFCGSDEFPNDFRKIKRQIFSRNLVKKFFLFSDLQSSFGYDRVVSTPKLTTQVKNGFAQDENFFKGTSKKIKKYALLISDRFVYSYNLIIFRKIPLRQKVPISKLTSFLILFVSFSDFLFLRLNVRKTQLQIFMDFSNE